MIPDFALTVISSAAVSAALSGLLLLITKTWIKITEKFEGSVKDVLAGLEKQFRQLLGDES